MTIISGVDNKKLQANYNAVKIQINDPVTSIPEGFKPSTEDNGIYNAVNLEVNRPTVDVRKNYDAMIYDYPQNREPIPFQNAVPQPVKLPKMPILPLYQTNYINNRTLVNADIEVKAPKNINKESFKNEIENEIENNQKLLPAESEVIESIEVVQVPEPNFTTIEEQKSPFEAVITEKKIDTTTPDVSFHGISFKGDSDNIKHEVEIIPGEEIKPTVDIHQVITNLENEDFDIQAQQMEEIARVAMLNTEDAIPYIVTDIYKGLIEIATKDTSNLAAPTEAQTEARQKIIINTIVKEQAKANNQDIDKLELPFTITEEEKQLATTLTSMEQAERNKEYALYTMAILSKIYTDEIEKQTGNVVPLTDLPGISTIVDTLRYNNNPSVKIAAIDALRYIKRDEYNEELKSIFTLSAQDENPTVIKSSVAALESLNQ